MSILEMIKEWEKGCANSMYRDLVNGTDLHIPEKCSECIAALIGSIKSIALNKPSFIDNVCQLTQGELSDFILLHQDEKPVDQPKQYRYEQVAVADTCERIDGDMCVMDNLFFQWSQSNIVPIKEVDARTLILNQHKLVRRIELTPEELREQEVEELGRKLLTEYEHSSGTFQDRYESLASYILDNHTHKG